MAARSLCPGLSRVAAMTMKARRRPVSTCLRFAGSQLDRLAVRRLLGELMRQERDHRRFLGLQAMSGIRELFLRALLQRIEQAAVQVAVENRRMDIALAADR